jgi:threonine dehydratase
MEDPHRFKGRRVGVIISGGNIDEELLRRVASA